MGMGEVRQLNVLEKPSEQNIKCNYNKNGDESVKRNKKIFLDSKETSFEELKKLIIFRFGK